MLKLAIASNCFNQSNNSNILSFGARVVGIELAKMIVDSWLEAEFEEGRHAQRVKMIEEIENNEGLMNK